MSSPLTKVRLPGMNLPTAILWERIQFWHKAGHKTDRFNGQDFIVMSRDAWCKDSSLTLKQYRTSLAFLKKRGLVRTQQHKDKCGLPVTWLSVSGTTQEGPLGTTHVGPYGTTHVGPFGTTQVGPFGTTLKSKEGKEEGKEEGKFALAVARKSSPGSSQGVEAEQHSTTTQEGSPLASALDMQKIMQATQSAKRTAAKNPTKDPSTTDTATAVYDVWRKNLSILVGFAPSKPTGPQWGKLKYITEQIKEDGRLSPQFVVAYLVNHWDEFAGHLKAFHNGWNVPATPCLQSLFKNVGPAVSWVLTRLEDEAAYAKHTAALAFKTAALAASKALAATTAPADAPKAPPPLKKPANGPVPLTQEERFEQWVLMCDGNVAKAQAEWLEMGNLPLDWATV